MVDDSKNTDDFKIEYLKDEKGNETGVLVNGEWYSSLQSYFEKREEAYKNQDSGSRP